MKDIISVARQFDIGEIISVTRYGSGRINETFLLKALSSTYEKAKPKQFILQKLHRILKADVLNDIEVITGHLKSKGLSTQRLVRTLKGELGFWSGSDTWRMLTYIPGITIEKGISSHLAEKGAALVGLFHNALSGLKYNFLHGISDFHDTDAIMHRLSQITPEFRGTEKYNVLSPMIMRVLTEYRVIKKKLNKLPDRIIHGDLKLNNIIFDEKGKEALSLIDLDTLGRNKIVVDIGDAIRSWCHNADEGERVSSRFDLDIFESMMKGYLRTAVFMTGDEKAAIPLGFETVTLELTARYLADAFEEFYFRLDNTHYPNLFEQNKEKAIDQMLLYDDFQKKKVNVEQIIRGYI